MTEKPHEEFSKFSLGLFMVCENLLYFMSQLVIIESIVEGLIFHCDYDQLLKFVVRLTPVTCWGQLQLI
jgi:hypothetical protein